VNYPFYGGAETFKDTKVQNLLIEISSPEEEQKIQEFLEGLDFKLKNRILKSSDGKIFNLTFKKN
jgi:hypothetical protein